MIKRRKNGSRTAARDRPGDGDSHATSVTAPASHAFPIVGVGASAGGLDAFTQLLKELPADTGMAFVLIQHLDPTHASFLREALAKSTAMPVSQAEDRLPIAQNQVYVIPPDADICIKSGLLTLMPRAPHSRRQHLPVDYFFRSLAAERGSRAIGVVLSGTASDGTEGLRAIKEEGGITMVQAPESAKFGEMPRSAMQAGVVDYALPIPELARELVRLSRHPYVLTQGDEASDPSMEDVAAFNEIMVMVRKTVGVDFTEYKRPTLQRRLARRITLRRAKGPQDYLALLRREPEEVRALYADTLIHVTSFFRDRGVYDVLESRIIPAILEKKPPEAPVRVWVAGCSSGEEVYSIAISLLDVVGESSHPIQVFGSDLSEAIITKARAGVYPDSALREVSEERRRRYFVKTERGYRISKAVRDLCVFVQHDLARDPPFSKLDLVSCRNVLIYFDQALQKRVIPTFHYALNQHGYLLLGRTENVSAFSQLFSVADNANKIFSRTSVASGLRFAPHAETRRAEKAAVAADGPPSLRGMVDVGKHLDRMLLARYAPPGVLINEKMEIIQFRGQTGSFLQAAPGEPQNNLIKMARPGLLAALRATLAEARKAMAPVRRNGVEVDQDGFTKICDLVVFPFTGLPQVKEPLYVVLFEEVTAREDAEGSPSAGTVRRSRRGQPRQDKRLAPRVEHELIATREYLQSLIEEHGRTNDDLGSANAELVSGNEELQSMNEELETAKEELQSTNEELTTVNDELHSRNEEVTHVNSDLLNLLITVDVPIVILDRERRIRRFTPKARTILNVLPTDTGRQLDDIKVNIDVPDLDRQIAQVIETVTMAESEVQDREGRWHRMQIRPYQTTDNKIDGAILSLFDIDALKHHVAEAQQARSEVERASRAKDIFLAVLGHELRTPLSSLLLQGQMLSRGTAMDAGRLIRAGETIERATRMQMQLIDDLLDTSRIVAGKLRVKLAPVDLRGVVEAALESVSSIAKRKSMKMEVIIRQPIGPVAGDAGRLQQVVSNLLTNAIKFTPENGQVSLTVATMSDGWVELEVRDTGNGIEPGFLPQVFNRFSQEDSSSTRQHGGLGLGLAIVRHLIEQHGGTVTAESAGLEKGSTFTVRLPPMHLAPRAAEAADEPSEVAATTGRKTRNYRQIKDLRVLVVDDDPATREIISEILSEMGANVRVTDSVAAAMSAISEFKPRVLLCDIAMPGEDGYSMIRRLRALAPQGGGGIPALALTALASEDDRQRALDAGFQMHLAKPVDMDRLADAVVQLVERRRRPIAPSVAPAGSETPQGRSRPH
jgi:two-component system CheB/CheR fusion protein